MVTFQASHADYMRVRPDSTVRYQYDRICAMQLKPNGQLRHIADIHSCPNDRGDGLGYFSESQATSNADGTRIAFASSWTGRNGAPASQSETFMVGLPSGALS